MGAAPSVAIAVTQGKGGDINADIFSMDDVYIFLETYTSEGSLYDKWEPEFFLRVFPQGCFVYKDKGQPVAFVTSIAYGASGWLGNLIVRKDYRGRGIGKMLTECAIKSLRSAGVQSIWLSATEAGKWIYQGLGFVEVDVINQWMGLGHTGKPWDMPGMDVDKMISLDAGCWGDRREPMIKAISQHGRVIAGPDSFLVIQQWNHGFVQLGPWVVGKVERARGMLDAALAQIGPTSPVFSYVPSLNVAAAMLLVERHFIITQRNTLMCLGSDTAYSPMHIFGLANPSFG